MSTRDTLVRPVYLSGIGWDRDLSFVAPVAGGETARSPEAVEALTGILTRSRAGAKDPAEMADSAVRDLAGGSTDALDGIDFLLVHTTTPILAMPSTAAILAGSLFGGRPVPAVDVGGSCAGFLVALKTAAALIGTGGFRKILVVSLEKKSVQLCPTHGPETEPLFGDMAAATLLTDRPIRASGWTPLEIRAVRIGCRGDLAPLIYRETDLCDGRPILRMNGGRVFREAVSLLAREIPDFLAGQGLSTRDLATAVFHQANVRLLARLSRRLGLPEDRVPLSLPRYGNTSSASLPLTLGRVLSGLDPGPCPASPVLLAAIGGGLTFGAALLIQAKAGSGP